MVKKNKSLGNFFAYLSCNKKSFIPAHVRFEYKISLASQVKNKQQAIKLFRMSYSNKTKEHIGYNDLPEYYTQGFAKNLDNVNKDTFLVEIYKGKSLVAIASIIFHPQNKTAGIYSVAVPPNERKQGLGLFVTSIATQFAFKNGAKQCILETESNSTLQKMYEKLGYKVNFHLQYTKLPN